MDVQCCDGVQEYRKYSDRWIGKNARGSSKFAKRMLLLSLEEERMSVLSFVAKRMLMLNFQVIKNVVSLSAASVC